MSRPTPGAGGAYLYDPATDSYLLVDRLDDPAAPAHPFEPPAPVLSGAEGPVLSGAEGPAPEPANPDEDLLP